MNQNPKGKAPEHCTRFEDEALEQIERGEPLDERLDQHLAACADCLEARRVYDAMVQALAQTGASAEPSQGWEDDVRARIQNRQGSRRRWAWGGLAAAAALALVLVRLPSNGPVHEPLRLTGQIVSSDETVRGLYAKPGDALLLRAEAGERRFVELRLYRDEAELILRCSDEPPCVRDGETLTARVLLPAVGMYQPLLMASDRPLPETTDGFDRDAGRALEHGAEVRFLDDIDVR